MGVVRGLQSEVVVWAPAEVEPACRRRRKHLHWELRVSGGCALLVVALASWGGAWRGFRAGSWLRPARLQLQLSWWRPRLRRRTPPPNYHDCCYQQLPTATVIAVDASCFRQKYICAPPTCPSPIAPQTLPRERQQRRLRVWPRPCTASRCRCTPAARVGGAAPGGRPGLGGAQRGRGQEAE